MRFLVVVFLSMFVVTACEADCPKCDEKILVTLSEGKIVTQMFKDVFPNGTKVEKSDVRLGEDKKMYLYRTGYDRKKNCTVSRTLLHESKVASRFVLMMRMNGTTETCSGDGCSHCTFKAGGGCDCKNSTNTCNHTISKNTELIKWW